MGVAASSCNGRPAVVHRSFPDGGLLKGAAPLPAGALKALAGIFDVTGDATRFGNPLVVHTTRQTLSLLGDRYASYAVLRPGCIEGGTKLVLEGEWRYATDITTGLARLFVEPAELATALCAGKSAPAGFDAKTIRLTGTVGEGGGVPTNPTTLSYSRPLVDLRGRFVVGGHHGACRTIDDCGVSENSVETLPLAESMGASVVALDVQLTKDHVPILFHDDNFGPRLTRGSFCHGKVADFSLVHIRSLCKLTFGEDIPTLDEALQKVVDDTELGGVWLDSKSPEVVAYEVDAAQRFATIAARKGRSVKVIVGLPDAPSIDAYLAAKPPAGQLCLVELELSDVRRAGCQAWAPRFTRGPMVDQVHEAQAEGKAVTFWTIDEPEFIDLFLRAHPNGMLTDRMSLLYHRVQTLVAPPAQRQPAL